MAGGAGVLSQGQCRDARTATDEVPAYVRSLRARKSGSPVAGALEHASQPGGDRNDLFGAYGMRHRIGVPLHLVAPCLEELATLFTKIDADHRVKRAMREENRYLLIGGLSLSIQR